MLVNSTKLRIDMFVDKEICSKMSRDTGNIMKKRTGHSIVTTNKKELEIALAINDPDKPRVYDSIVGYYYDTAYELERSGYCSNNKGFIIEISMKNNLGFILSLICGCSPAVLDNFPNATHLSKALFELNEDSMNKCNLLDLLDLDPKLDMFLNSLVNIEYPSTMSLEDSILYNILGRIYSETQHILSYLGVYMSKQGYIWRSKSLHGILLTSSKPLEDLELIFPDRDTVLFLSPSNLDYTSKKGAAI